METDIDDIEVKLNNRKSPECLYCGEKHTYDKCKHPDIIEFSEYLVKLYKDLYQLQSSLENKYMAAYNLLSEYSVNLLITAGRNKSNWCKFKKTYGNKIRNLDKKDVINELTDCMFSYIKYKFPELTEGNVNKSFVQAFRNSIPSLLNNKNEASAPPQENINLDEVNYTDIHKPSAPPMMETGGKRRRTRKRLIKNKKSKRRH